MRMSRITIGDGEEDATVFDAGESDAGTLQIGDKEYLFPVGATSLAKLGQIGGFHDGHACIARG